MTGPGTVGQPDQHGLPVDRVRLCLPCLVCGTELEPVFPETARDGAAANPHPPHGQPLAAVTFQGEPGYGSSFDTTVPGPLEINICDGCLARGGQQGRVNWVRIVRTSRSTYYPWQGD
jgi:hypothetical protein